MEKLNPFPVFVDSATHIEIRTPVGGRTFLELENTDAAVVYYETDTFADPNRSRRLQAGGNANSIRSWGVGATAASAIPQGSLWLLGFTAAGTLQRVLVTQA